MNEKRSAVIERNTKETQINLTLELDGKGDYSIQTSVGFFNHMLELFTRHGLFNLTLEAKGDIHVDYHHLVEDVGICLGKAFHKALGDCSGIKRYASITLPMDESLVSVALDIGGRPCLVYNVPDFKGKVGEFDFELVEEFLRGFVTNAKINLHVDLIRGENLHHIAEAIFKGISRALREAIEKDNRVTGIPSTKGIL